MNNFVYACLLIAAIAGCARAASNDEADTRLSIAGYRYPGAGESLQLCYVVVKPNGEKEFMYDGIKGFTFEWGYDYVLNVEKVTVGHPKADEASFAYQLKNVVSKKRISPQQQIALPVQFNEQLVVEQEKGVCTYFKEININTGKFTCTALQQAQTGQFRFSSDGKTLELIDLK